MDQFKIELHAHTPIISPCGKVPPEVQVARYHEAGYAAITVTDHYFPGIFRHNGIDRLPKEERFDAFLEGYRQVKAIAENLGMVAYYGAEMRFYESCNDFLLYGFSKELLSDPDEIWSMGIAAFSRLARDAGALLIQAHPFRTGSVPVAPCLLDGIEAVNRHDCHNNRNDRALELAHTYGLLKTGGTDFHDPEDQCVGGIVSSWLPKDSMELAELIRSGDFEILGWKEALRGR